MSTAKNESSFGITLLRFLGFKDTSVTSSVREHLKLKDSKSTRRPNLDVGLSKTARDSKMHKEMHRTRFEDCCKELSTVLTPDICNKLADYFGFTTRQKAFRKSSTLVTAFVQTLNDQRLIKPNDSSLLENGLKNVGETVLASRVTEMFRKPLLKVDVYTLQDLHWQFVYNLKQSYASQCEVIGTLDQEYYIDQLYIDGRVEVLISDDGINGIKMWKELEKYHDIASIALRNERVILEGSPGYGKSMLMLQLVYEWCGRVGTSPMSQVDLVFLLKLEKIDGDQNIYHAVRRMLLPDESPIDVEIIENIVLNCSSVMFLIDGLHKMSEDRNHWISNFLLHEAKTKRFPVVVTARPGLLPEKYLLEMQRCRLCGFDFKAKETYVRKIVLANNKDGAEETSNKVNRIVGRASFSDIPLLFCNFAYMVSQEKYGGDASAITTVFGNIMSSITGSAKTKIVAEARDISENSDQYSIGKVAYDTLMKNEETMVCTKEELTDVIGRTRYNLYKDIGVLQEGEVNRLKPTSQPPDYYNCELCTGVSFCHNIFVEWYAAHYLVKQTNCLTYLQDISPVKFPNVFRFCCGLQPSNAGEIIDHIKQYAGGERFALLCSVEKHGRFDNAIKESVIDLCSQDVTFSIDDSRLMQRSMMEIVELALLLEIPVSRLSLINCLDFSHLYEERLFLLSGEALSSHRLQNVKAIQITEKVRRLDHQQTEKIMKFATKCCQLTTLIFLDCLPPWTTTTKAQRTQRNIKVQWVSKMLNTYQLNTLGKWEFNGKELPIHDYNKEVCCFEKQPITQKSSKEKEQPICSP
ncbi:hypothetical protein HOLleu_04203 [Holothuria leucospilota]|uniref:NACHT domain-containing protein n=1 Tax=Holothuria leucospilota TaxID=206669 RepID=A0A9Q1CT00_HOLLE|nr:hypothetical protein HOLleu_04203 [Holothuria leucospilota]